MKTWQKAILVTLVTLSIGGVYHFSVWKHRQDPGVIGRKGPGLKALKNAQPFRGLKPTAPSG